jgi:two-component system, OmpR family, response regulator ChvI
MQDGKHVILCIDDDPDLLFSLKVVLESNGYIVHCALNAKEAIKSFRDNPPDVLIVDLMMEEIDTGMRLVQDIHSLGNKSPLYLLSSSGDYLHGMTDLSELGVTGIFQKPISPEFLLSLLRTKLKG